MNKVILIGRLTKKAELRYTESNKAVATFTLAVDRGYKNDKGESEADFINIVVWNKQAENVNKYLDKGSKISVDGSLRIRKYKDNNGNNKYVTEVLANSIEFLDSKNSEKVSPAVPEKSETLHNPVQQKSVWEDFGETVEIVDEELPFE